MSERYARQLDILEIGEAGQNRLKKSSVLVIGAGGLGSALLFCLAGAGVGCIGVADHDVVSDSNLNRQFLYTAGDVGKPKVDCAIAALRAFNPELHYEPYAQIENHNVRAAVAPYDVVVAAVDNLPVRLAVNEACCESGIPLVNGSVEGMYGMVNTVHPHESACLECMYGGVREYHATPTSFAPIVSTISSIMAQETLLMLLGCDDPLKGRLLHFDGIAMSFETLPARRRDGCAVCGGESREQ